MTARGSMPGRRSSARWQQPTGSAIGALAALDQTSYNTGTISADRNQRSFRLSLDEFMQRRGADTIAQRGVRLKGQHAGLLQRIEQRYGVPPGPLLAIWGMETAFGGFLGDHNIVSSNRHADV